MPIVIFMHGCSGINEGAITWAHFLTRNQVTVVMPDSLAIPGRPSNCDDQSKNRNLNLVPVRELRPAEAVFVLDELTRLPWVDKNNVFLMGHSEGGMATALAKDHRYAGRIISGYKCVKGGIKGPKDTPVLVINWEIDPWFDRQNAVTTQCADQKFWQKRTNATQLILRGKGHSTANDANAREAVVKFIQENRTMP